MSKKEENIKTNKKTAGSGGCGEQSTQATTAGYKEKGNESFVDYEYELQVERQKGEAVLDMARRLQADFDNYRKRNLELGKTARDDGIADTVKAFLPVFDAMVAAEGQITDEHTLEGIAIIKREFVSALGSFGVAPLDALGKPFDPELHNAIYAESKPGSPPNLVTEEIQKGFIRGDKVVRHAVVKISK